MWRFMYEVLSKFLEARGQADYEGEEWKECQYLTELIYSALASWYMKPLSFKLPCALYSIVS